MASSEDSIVTDKEQNKVRVLYSDDQLIAVHKPYGQSFHSEPEHQGIVQTVRQQLADPNLYPVHRLDKLTSGIMLFARHSEANRALSQLFAERKVEKYYLALSDHKPKKKQGSISGDMAKSRNGSYKLLRTTQQPQPARTRFFAAKYMSDKARWCFILKPETGKTHQLRVALKSLSSPILGDRRYQGSVSDRGYLHAYKLRFSLGAKEYELCDDIFEGEHFSGLVTQLDILNWRSPERLPWPGKKR